MREKTQAPASKNVPQMSPVLWNARSLKVRANMKSNTDDSRSGKEKGEL